MGNLRHTLNYRIWAIVPNKVKVSTAQVASEHRWALTFGDLVFLVGGALRGAEARVVALAVAVCVFHSDSNNNGNRSQ